jgi:hypothetical protein
LSWIQFHSNNFGHTESILETTLDGKWTLTDEWIGAGGADPYCLNSDASLTSVCRSSSGGGDDFPIQHTRHTRNTIGDDFVCTLEEEVERKKERMINAPTDLSRQWRWKQLTAHILRSVSRCSDCHRQTHTTNTHHVSLSQQLLHIRDHHTQGETNREMLFALDWTDFHRLLNFYSLVATAKSRFFSRVFLRANRLNYKRPSFILDRRQVWLVYLSDACCIVVDDESIKPVTTACFFNPRDFVPRPPRTLSSIDYVSAETSSSQIGRQEER